MDGFEFCQKVTDYVSGFELCKFIQLDLPRVPKRAADQALAGHIQQVVGAAIYGDPSNAAAWRHPPHRAVEVVSGNQRRPLMYALSIETSDAFKQRIEESSFRRVFDKLTNEDITQILKDIEQEERRR